MLLYFAIFLLGFLFLVVTFALGEVFDFLGGHLDALGGDHFDGGVHPLSGKIVAAALTAFGATGMLTRVYDFGTLPSVLTSALVALLFGALVWWLMSVLYRQTASTDVSVQSMLGQIAEVTVSIPVGSVGEVVLATTQSTRHMLARAGDGLEIPTGTRVRVVETLGGFVVVERAPLPAAASADARIEG